MNLKAARTAQRPLIAEFQYNFNDTMLDVAGVSKDFGLASLAMAFDVINLPPNAVVVGGDITTETAFDTAAYSVQIGDSAVANRYLAATDVKALGRTALVPSGFRNVDGLNLRITIANTDGCTTGKGTVRVHYIISGRADEVQPF